MTVGRRERRRLGMFSPAVSLPIHLLFVRRQHHSSSSSFRDNLTSEKRKLSPEEDERELANVTMKFSGLEPMSCLSGKDESYANFYIK